MATHSALATAKIADRPKNLDTSAKCRNLATPPDSERCVDVAAHLRLLHPEGEPYELRALGCNKSNWRTASCICLDASTGAAAVARIKKNQRPTAIWLTINSRTPPPANAPIGEWRFNGGARQKGLTTTHQHITARRHLLIDVDPVRPVDQSATDDEMAAAWALADVIATDLAAAGWPAPLPTMSGNGTQLLYRIDLPADAESAGLVRGVLHALGDRYSTDAVKVDTSPHDAPRVAKLAGTMVRKGEDTAERPHRQAWFIRAEGPLEVVPEQLLRDLAGDHIVITPERVDVDDPGDEDAPPSCVTAARKALALMPPAVEGEHGRHKLFAACCRVFSYGLSRSQARELIEAYNERCAPPWDEDDQDFENTIENGRRKVIAVGEFGKFGEQLSAAEEFDAVEAIDVRPVVRLIPGEPHSEAIEAVLGPLGAYGCGPATDERSTEAKQVFCRGAMLVDIQRQSKPVTDPKQLRTPVGTAFISPLPKSQLVTRITDACRLVKEVTARGLTHDVPLAEPKKWLVDAIHERRNWHGFIRPLVSIIHAPTIRPDGSTLQVPGYDETTGLYYAPEISFPDVPERPTREDARRSLAKLSDLVTDFPFSTTADKSVWLALALTALCRSTFVGCVPMFAIAGNAPGVGKGKLIDLAAILAYGRPAARSIYTPDNGETRKFLTSVAIQASPMVLFDNVDAPVGNASLDAALTSTVWEDRVLGSSRTTGELPWRAIVTTTGNNIRFVGDAGRRVMMCRLHTDVEQPQTRSDFKRSDIEGWARRHRAELVVAALTVVRAYTVLGCPPMNLTGLGSYSEWSSLIRGALVFAGAEDPAKTADEVRAADDTLEIVQMIHFVLGEVDPDGEGLATGQILSRACDLGDDGATYEVLKTIIGGVPTSQKLAVALKRHRGRIVAGRSITSKPDRRRLQLWSVADCGA